MRKAYFNRVDSVVSRETFYWTLKTEH
jgi:hypothetical protein